MVLFWRRRLGLAWRILDRQGCQLRSRPGDAGPNKVARLKASQGD